jgi:NADH-quinone oxidoreductase subunit H
VDWIDIATLILRNILIVAIILGIAPVLVWLERRGSGIIQDRPGPERAAIGPFRLFGLLHPLADGIKLISKEFFIPEKSNKFYFIVAPMIVLGIPLITMAIVPWWDNIVMPDGRIIPGQVLNVNPSLLWFFAIVSLTVYGIIFAGWSSNSKYSLLGAVRASAAVLSYEIPMGLAVIGALMYYGTINLPEIVHLQTGTWWGVIPKWGVFVQPLGALIFLVCAFAETNRAPFDLAEAESELVAGYHTEYSGMGFGMFLFAEYAAMMVSSGILITLYFGGWQVPWLSTHDLIVNAQLLTQWTLGIVFAVTLILAALLLTSFSANVGTFKDWRDYEPLILALAIIGGGVTALLGLFFLLSFTLPAWYGPIFAAVAQFGIFIAKLAFFCWVFVWVRWTLPRFRYDQVMYLGWRSLLPLALANILLTGILITVLKL